LAKKSEKLTHFSTEELLSAHRQFDTLYDENIESPREYLERKRNRDMHKLILCIMENELDTVKSDIFARVFFYGEKFSDVAEKTGLSQASVYKHYDKAVKKIGKALKYVMLYQDVCTRDIMMPLQRMRDSAFLASGRVYPHAFALRLSRLMEKENVGKDKLCETLVLDRNRFGKIFCGKLEPVAGEIVLLSGFFGVSTDYILKGDLT